MIESNILHFDTEDLANQITLIDSKNFRSIRLCELSGVAWTKENANTISPNVLRMVKNIHLVAEWVVYSILNEKDHKNQKIIFVGMSDLFQV